MAFLKFAGDPRKQEAIAAQIQAGQQLRNKQRDTGSGLGRSEGITQRPSGRPFEEDVGMFQSEFGGAVAENPDVFYGDFMPRLLKLTSATEAAERGDFA